MKEIPYHVRRTMVDMYILCGNCYIHVVVEGKVVKGWLSLSWENSH